MDSKLYKAAAAGDIKPLRSSGIPLDQLITPIGNTILHIYLAAGARKSSSKFVNQVLTLCPALLTQANTISGDTPLHVAAQSWNPEAVTALIAQAKALNQQDPERGTREVHTMMSMKNRRKDTALHEAARNNNLIVVKILKKEGPDLEYEANGCYKSPLYLAAEGGHCLIVEEMLQTCTSIASDGPKGKTPLHAAVISSSGFSYKTCMVNNILEKLKHLSNKEDDDGWTALHYAAYLDNSTAAKMILEADPSAAYAANNERRMTALHVAGKSNAVKTIRVIISLCHDCCQLVDAKGWNFVHYAVITRSFETIKWMFVSTRPLHYLLNQPDVNAKTPLHLLAASENRPGEHFSEFPDFLDVKKVMISDTNVEEEASKWIQDLGDAPLGVVSRIKSRYHSREDRHEAILRRVEKSKDAYLVVAALIATVAFAAAFTLPGGLISDNNNPKQGTPVLLRKASFQWFLFWDVAALTLSTCCIVTNLLLTIAGFKRKSMWLVSLQLLLLSLAVGAMMGTFYSGLYTVLWSTRWVIRTAFWTQAGFVFLFTFIILGSPETPFLIWESSVYVTAFSCELSHWEMSKKEHSSAEVVLEIRHLAGVLARILISDS